VNDRLLVDGGVIDRVPITVAREMGADLVIAVDVALFDRKMEVQSIYDVIVQAIDIMEREILRHRMVSADLVLRPDVGHYNSLSYSHVREIIEEGERTALAHVDQIKELMRKWEEETWMKEHPAEMPEID
jgi:NTE family protein